MKVGQVIKPGVIGKIATDKELTDGVLRYRHPRCGRVVIRRSDHGEWIVTEVEKPDND